MSSNALNLVYLRDKLQYAYEHKLVPVEFRASPNLYMRLLAASYHPAASLAGLLRLEGVLHFFEVPIRPDTRCSSETPLLLLLSDGSVLTIDADETAAVVA